MGIDLSILVWRCLLLDLSATTEYVVERGKVL